MGIPFPWCLAVVTAYYAPSAVADCGSDDRETTYLVPAPRPLLRSRSHPAIDAREETRMNTRTAAAAVAALALAAPVAAGAKVVPAKHHTRPAVHVVKLRPAHRPVCICITTLPGAVPVESQAQLEADIDADMIAHGLDPIYGTATASTTTDTTDTATTAG
jgi:hypothetical protein